MYSIATNTSAVAALGHLIEYPDDSFQQRCADALDAVDAIDGGLAALLSEFARELGPSLEHARELYTRSFDLAPVCAPYVSVHLFGADSYKRAELMAGLAAAYERFGFDRGAELPDHIALILRHANDFQPEEWDDLAVYVLAPALEKMCAALETARSPWRHPLNVARTLLTLGDEIDGR